MCTTAIANKSQPDCVFVGPTSIYGFLAGGYTLRLVNSLGTAVVTASVRHEAAEVDAVKLCSHSSPKGAFLIPCKMQLSKVCDR